MFVILITNEESSLPDIYGPFETYEDAHLYVQAWMDNDPFSYEKDFSIQPVNFPAKWWY